MEKFYLEEPSQERKKDILDYLNEFVLYNSDVNGAGALDKILSGQSFEEEVLKPEGKFKAAEFRFSVVDAINIEDAKRCLAKSREIQWDYKNIVKNRGVLERLK